MHTAHLLESLLRQLQAAEETWRAAGKQLVEAEQQAAAKLAAKKAKKLRQKGKRQPLQQCSPSEADHPLEPSNTVGQADSSAIANYLDQETLSSLQLSPVAQALSSVASGAASSSPVGMQSSAVPGHSALPNMAQPVVMPPSQTCLDDPVDDAAFLQDLFTCPLTKVSYSVVSKHVCCLVNSIVWPWQLS